MGGVDPASERIGALTAEVSALNDRVDEVVDRVDDLVKDIYERINKQEIHFVSHASYGKGAAWVGGLVLTTIIALAGAVGWLWSTLHLKLTW